MILNKNHLTQRLICIIRYTKKLYPCSITTSAFSVKPHLDDVHKVLLVVGFEFAFIETWRYIILNEDLLKIYQLLYKWPRYSTFYNKKKLKKFQYFWFGKSINFKVQRWINIIKLVDLWYISIYMFVEHNNVFVREGMKRGK